MAKKKEHVVRGQHREALPGLGRDSLHFVYQANALMRLSVDMRPSSSHSPEVGDGVMTDKQLLMGLRFAALIGGLLGRLWVTGLATSWEA